MHAFASAAQGVIRGISKNCIVMAVYDGRAHLLSMPLTIGGCVSFRNFLCANHWVLSVLLALDIYSS